MGREDTEVREILSRIPQMTVRKYHCKESPSYHKMRAMHGYKFSTGTREDVKRNGNRVLLAPSWARITFRGCSGRRADVTNGAMGCVEALHGF